MGDVLFRVVICSGGIKFWWCQICQVWVVSCLGGELFEWCQVRVCQFWVVSNLIRWHQVVDDVVVVAENMVSNYKG